MSVSAAQVARSTTPMYVSAPSLWINSETTADLWSITLHALSDLRFTLQDEGHWSVEWRANSLRADASGRGCGLLFLRADVERVALIRRRCRCTIRQAIRIYDTIAREGPL